MTVQRHEDNPKAEEPQLLKTWAFVDTKLTLARRAETVSVVEGSFAYGADRN